MNFNFFFFQENSAKAIARYDLDKTWREFIIALVVPSVFFVISFTMLIMIARSVKVGDDTVLRCHLFGHSKNSRSEDKDKLKINNEETIENEEICEEMRGAKTRRNNVGKSSDNNGGTLAL